MTDKPTDEALENLFVEETGFDTDDFPAAIFGFARAVLAKWGTPAHVGVGEVAERYRNAIASACEGWTMPDGLRKHLEAALWSPPTPQPTQAQAAQADSVLEDAARYRFLRDGEWRDTDLEPFIRLQLNTLWDAKIDAARAAQEGGK